MHRTHNGQSIHFFSSSNFFFSLSFYSRDYCFFLCFYTFLVFYLVCCISCVLSILSSRFRDHQRATKIYIINLFLKKASTVHKLWHLLISGTGWLYGYALCFSHSFLIRFYSFLYSLFCFIFFSFDVPENNGCVSLSFSRIWSALIFVCVFNVCCECDCWTFFVLYILSFYRWIFIFLLKYFIEQQKQSWGFCYSF